MRKEQIRSGLDALLYITDCNLATVSRMAGLKNRGVNEYQRQINIAQICVDWCVKENLNIADSRALNVVQSCGGSVQQWADNYDVKKRHEI